MHKKESNIYFFHLYQCKKVKIVQNLCSILCICFALIPVLKRDPLVKSYAVFFSCVTADFFNIPLYDSLFSLPVSSHSSILEFSPHLYI